MNKYFKNWSDIKNEKKTEKISNILFKIFVLILTGGLLIALAWAFLRALSIN